MWWNLNDTGTWWLQLYSHWVWLKYTTYPDNYNHTNKCSYSLQSLQVNNHFQQWDMKLHDILQSNTTDDSTGGSNHKRSDGIYSISKSNKTTVF